MKRLFILCTCLCGFSWAYSQNYYQATAYFLSGVTRTVTSTDTFATVTASDINAVLSKYGLNSSNVYPAFPEFNEQDTLLLPNSELGRIDTIKQMDRAKIFVITVTDTTTRNNLITDLQGLSEVLFAEANGDDSLSVAPNDPAYTANGQWDLNNTLYPGHDIHAQTAWDIYQGTSNSIIGIIDDGVDFTEPDISAKYAGGDQTFYVETEKNGRKLSHGTAVAGIAAASTNNGIEMAGVDWNAKILSEDTHDYYNCFCLGFLSHKHGWNLTASKTLNAINFSPNVWTLNHSYELTHGFLGNNYSVVLAEAFAYAAKSNRVSCVAAGNDSKNSTNIYPPNYSSELIDVGGTDQQDNKFSLSNSGPNLDVVAPAVDITTINFKQFGSLTSEEGTSMSSPIVAGIASLLKGFNQSLYNDDIEQIIKLSADDQGVAGRDDVYGYGRVNAHTALSYLNPPYQLLHLTATGGTTYSTTDHGIVMLAGLFAKDGKYPQSKKIEVRTTINLPTDFCNIVGVWGDGLKTTGWHDDGKYSYGDGFCEVVPGSLTKTQVTLRTYVYLLRDEFGISYGYYPTSPQNVKFAYSILGQSDLSINGDATFCTTSNPYTITNLPTGATVAWSASPTGIITINSPNSSQTTLTKLNSGSVTLTVTISSSSCGVSPITITKQIYAGTPYVYSTYNYNGSQNPIHLWGSDHYYNPACNLANTTITSNIQGSNSVTWSKVSSSPANISWVQSGNNMNFYFYNVGQNAVFEIDAGNTCGTTTQQYGFSSVSCGDGGGCSEFTVSPDPVSGTMNIVVPDIIQPCNVVADADNTSATTNPAVIVEIQVYDQMGVLKVDRKFSKVKTASVGVSSLNSGIYFVQIFDGTKFERQKVIINN
ncbi:MAG TPA: S8 family peptidase [Chitinophagaceae bacterium]|nr:S8 family peptidase [Chitinophagaceae bacterium]